jgi:hypothetical protein
MYPAALAGASGCAMAAATANHDHDKRKTHIKKAGLSASVKAGAAQAN